MPKGLLEFCVIQGDAFGELLRSFEEEMLSPGVRKDAGCLEALLDDGFREFGSSGRVYTKPEIVEALATEAPIRLSLRDFRAERLAEDVVLVTYRSGRGDGREALRSSVWVRRDGRWRMLFHQGTRVPAHEPA